MPSSVDVSPLLMPAARKYAASDAMRMSAAAARQKPPPIAAPFTAAITGWCMSRTARITSSSTFIARRGDAGALQPRDVRHHPAADEVGTRAEPVPGAGEHDDPALVVEADLAQGIAERDHHVERHRVHALRSIQRHQRDVRARLLDHDERHGRSLRTAPVGAARMSSRDSKPSRTYRSRLAGFDDSRWAASMRPSPSSTGSTRAPSRLRKNASSAIDSSSSIGRRPGGVQMADASLAPAICTEPQRRPAVRKKSHSAGECACRSSGPGKTQLHNGSAKNGREMVSRTASPSLVVAYRTSRVTVGRTYDGLTRAPCGNTEDGQ